MFKLHYRNFSRRCIPINDERFPVFIARITVIFGESLDVLLKTEKCGKLNSQNHNFRHSENLSDVN